jgi:hypothetical protein
MVTAILRRNMLRRGPALPGAHDRSLLQQTGGAMDVGNATVKPMLASSKCSGGRMIVGESTRH